MLKAKDKSIQELVLLESFPNTHLIHGMLACIPFCHKPSRFIYYLSNVTVLSKYPNTLRKFSELLVRDIVYWYWTKHHRLASCDI